MKMLNDCLWAFNVENLNNYLYYYIEKLVAIEIIIKCNHYLNFFVIIIN